MDFAEWIREQATKTYTENGAAARNTTGDARLDLFATIGSLRKADQERIELLFAEAYQADPLFALKILFYARDIREGLGERRVFRILLQYLADSTSRPQRQFRSGSTSRQNGRKHQSGQGWQ